MSACGADGADQPAVSHGAAALPPSAVVDGPGATVPETTVRLSNVLIGQIQRLNVGSADLELDCPGGLCAPLPEARLRCVDRSGAEVISTASPLQCWLRE